MQTFISSPRMLFRAIQYGFLIQDTFPRRGWVVVAPGLSREEAQQYARLVFGGHA